MQRTVGRRDTAGDFNHIWYVNAPGMDRPEPARSVCKTRPLALIKDVGRPILGLARPTKLYGLIVPEIRSTVLLGRLACLDTQKPSFLRYFKKSISRFSYDTLC